MQGRDRRLFGIIFGLFVACLLAIFVFGRGPGTLVWLTGGPPAWLPFAGSGVSWLANVSGGGPNGTAAAPSPSPSGAGPSPAPSSSPSPDPSSSPTPGLSPTPSGPAALGVSAIASAGAGVVPVTVDFAASVSGGTAPYAYSWGFGDGTTSGAPNPAHTFGSTGVYTVSLSVSDSGGQSAFATVTVAVVPPISVTAGATPTSGQAPLAVNFTGGVAGGLGPYTYAWNFGDGSTSSSRSTAHTYVLAGAYTATLTVSDSTGSASAAVKIAVSQPPPKVTSVSPASGPDRGGSTVTINGGYFDSATAVTFGGRPATSFTLISANKITAVTPAQPANTVDVLVTTPIGVSTAGTADRFNYLLSWVQLAPATSPSARQNPALAADGTGEVVMFGGSTSKNVLNDTWVWDGGNWTRISTSPGSTPPARANAAVAYDANRGLVVMFGGSCSLSGTCLLNDTWTWNGKTRTWTLAQADTATPAANQPSRRMAAGMARGPVGRALLFGGVSGTTYLNDTWVFTGGGWSQASANGQPGSPGARANAYMGTDQNGLVVLFGGADSSGVFGDTWTWNGIKWNAAGPSSSPSARAHGAMALFQKPQGASTSGLQLFGGQDGAGRVLGDTWTWDGSNWNLYDAGSSGDPTPRVDMGMATDPNGGVLMFGGRTLVVQTWRWS